MFHQSGPGKGELRRFEAMPAQVCFSAGAALLLAACAGDVVDVGENVPYPAGTRCQADATVRGSVIVENQEQLDELAGCEVIEGNLDIVPFRDADLRPLHALLRVDGDVVIGSRIADPPPFLPGEMDALNASQEVDLYHRGLQRARGLQWLATLDGLERLEVVGSLTIEAPIESLEAFSGLREIATGRLTLYNTELSDLIGLEGVRGVTELSIKHDDLGRLHDMTALLLPASMKSLTISAPVEALDVSDVRSISHLALAGLFLDDLDMFQGLQRAETISIDDCLFLRHLAGLDGVTGITSFSASNNLSLERLTESLNAVEQLETFSLEDNPRLESLPEFTVLERITAFEIKFSSFLESTPAQDLELPRFPRMNLESAAPVHLERIFVMGTGAPSFVVPRAWNSAEWVQIEHNYEMRELDFGGLETVGRLGIVGNPELTRVTLGSLKSVTESSTDIDGLVGIDGL